MSRAKLLELSKLLEKWGFYYDVEELAESKGDYLELTKKAYGDGWTKDTEEYFGKDYVKLSKLCKDLGIKVPEIVEGD